MLDIASQYRIISSDAALRADPSSDAALPAASRGTGATGRTSGGGAGAGWRRRNDCGRLRFSGRDRTTFLQALLTNDVSSLQEGQGVYAAYLTPQGRMVTDLRLHVRADHVIADVPASLAARLAIQFDQLIFSEDVQVTDVSASVAQVTVCGVGAADVLTTAMSSLRPGHDGFVAPTDESTLPSYDAFVPEGLVDGMTRALAGTGAIPMSDELAEALRIEAGRPVFGVDMTEDTIPLEAGLLERAISTTKGCYPGQEVVIRVLHRGGGRVARRLVRLTLGPGSTSPPPAGTLLLADGRETGRITSAAWSPASDCVVALGYVHRDVAELHRTVDVGAPAMTTATITGFAS